MRARSAGMICSDPGRSLILPFSNCKFNDTDYEVSAQYKWGFLRNGSDFTDDIYNHDYHGMDLQIFSVGGATLNLSETWCWQVDEPNGGVKQILRTQVCNATEPKQLFIFDNKFLRKLVNVNTPVSGLYLRFSVIP